MKEADNNVKLIVLDRLIDLRDHPTQEKVLQVYCGLVQLYIVVKHIQRSSCFPNLFASACI